MRVLITGAQGMLAQALMGELVVRGHDAVGYTRSELDITDRDAVREAIDRVRPDAVVQCAAYTRVDDAEAEPDRALAVNAQGTANVAESCAQVGALLVYPSTDYVFSGSGCRPYRPDDPVAPLNSYGRSKLAGEHAASTAGISAIVRTSWLYGAGGGNFVDTIRRLATQRDRLEVVDDQVGRPTWTGSLSAGLCRIVEARATGIFHLTDGGEPTSWFGFAREILRLSGIQTLLEPVPSTRFPRPAPRPPYSVLDCSGTEEILGSRVPDWRTTLAGFLADRDQPHTAVRNGSGGAAKGMV